MFALSIKYIETHENLVAVSAKVFVSATFKWPTKHIGDKHKYSLASHGITWNHMEKKISSGKSFKDRIIHFHFILILIGFNPHSHF